MRGRLIKIERPKGYVNIDEVYKQLSSVEKEEDCEYGDFGEVLSKWATCDYGEILNAISCCDVIKAIPLDKVKQAINEVSKLRLESGVKGNIIDDEIYIDSMAVLNILDKLIAESEG